MTTEPAMPRALQFVIVGFLFVLSGCAGKTNATRSSAEPQSIGLAWLENDGTLVMQLRAEDHGRALGDALLKYKPDDPQYRRLLEHVGSLKPGQTNSVPPWPPGEPNQVPLK